MERLLTDNQEIEALLSRGKKRSKKQGHEEKKEIQKMLDTNSNLKPTVQEIDLTNNINKNQHRRTIT